MGACYRGTTGIGYDGKATDSLARDGSKADDAWTDQDPGGSRHGIKTERRKQQTSISQIFLLTCSASHSSRRNTAKQKGGARKYLSLLLVEFFVVAFSRCTGHRSS